MRPITVSARRGAPAETAADTRVVGLFDGETLADPALQALVELGSFSTDLATLIATNRAELDRIIANLDATVADEVRPRLERGGRPQPNTRPARPARVPGMSRKRRANSPRRRRWTWTARRCSS